MTTRSRRIGGAGIVAAALLGSFSGGCGGDDTACGYAVCDIEEEACIRSIAEAVACHLDRDVIYPEVRFLTAEEYLAEAMAESEPPTAEEEQEYADYLRALALIGLMPEDYESGDVSADAFRNFVALYSLEHKHIVMISDRAAKDAQGDYVTLVHEFAHAHQDAAWDIRSLYDMFAPTYDRQLGVRAFIEGDAERVDDLAYVELEKLPLPQVDWDGYFDAWQGDALQRAAETETPWLDVGSLFPYPFGGELAVDAWLDGGEEKIGELAAQPPDSVRQVMEGYSAWPDDFKNGDVAFDPRAVAVLPDNYQLISGGHEGVWLINAMLQRTADGGLWSPELDDVSADFLVTWRAGTDMVTMWRIRSERPQELMDALTRGAWVDAEASADPATHIVSRADGDVLLIAVSNGDAHVVLADIAGWQSPEEAFPDPDAGGIRGPRWLESRLACPGHAGHRPRHRVGD